MPTFFWKTISRICWALLSLRYKITVKGLKELEAAHLKQGVLFMPNHPAHMDPLFLFLLLWPKYRMRSVVVEYIYRLSILRPFMKLIKAVAVPNFDSSINQIKVKKANDSIQAIADGLKKGENFVIYPAGRLKNSGKEIVGGASGSHALVQECPNIHIVLIRTTGLWGSSFSRALLGHSPPLPEILRKGVFTLLKNGIFFAPRRRIQIEIVVDPKDIPRQGSRLEFNRYLENWYNRYPDGHGNTVGVEPLYLVSYSFWKKDFPDVFHLKSKEEGNGDIQIADETRSKIYAEIRRIINHPGIAIKAETNLALDLGMDSLNIAELIGFIAKTYGIEEIHPEDVQTVQNVLETAEGARGSERSARPIGEGHWPPESGRPSPTLPDGKTIPEAFLRSCARMRGKIACADDLVGVWSYQRLKRAAIVLSLYFRTLPDSYIGVLLPSSVGAYLVILALQFAKKVPVMLNWTLGSRYLEEMMKMTGATRVISSWRFLERVSNVDFGSLVDSIQLLEDIREQLPLRSKLWGAVLSMRSIPAILNSLNIHPTDENHPAVILFTSGTEANPKGVPLSHQNILSNQRAAMQCIDLNREDVLYGVLPPFHSFGFSVVGLFPLCAGVKVAFYPDPTDGFALAEGIERWKITLFCSPPSFLKGLFNAARAEQLTSVRLFISGAEKAPPELFERVKNLRGGAGAQLIEGYGITECAPILAIMRSNLPPKGVGQPLPNVELCTIHLETLKPLPKGSEGEICVRGPNVFKGYLGHPRDPFIVIESQPWYRTGDIGYLDEDENLILSGRIKRFTKVGGEMISLGGVEETLVKAFIEKGVISADIPALAVVADEKVQGQPQLILFSTVALGREEVNQVLHEMGFSRLVKIAAVKKVDEIPLMGTGKTDYRRLQNQLNPHQKHGNVS